MWWPENDSRRSLSGGYKVPGIPGLHRDLLLNMLATETIGQKLDSAHQPVMLSVEAPNIDFQNHC